MKSRNLLLIITFLNVFCASHLLSQNIIRVTDEPKWIDPIEFVLDTSENSPFEYLLVDFQENSVSEESFQHYVIKLNNSDGVQEMSNISIDYDPNYESIKFHEIIIHRGKEQIEKAVDGFKFLQRETDMNRAIYDGAISVVKDLRDTRPGDIIEYSYTIKGYNPLYGKHRFFSFYQEFGVHISKLYQTYLIDKDVSINYNLSSTEAEVTKENNLWKYTWNLENVKPTYEDFTVPPWYEQRKSVTMSTMKSWEEVVDWGQVLYKMSAQEKRQFRLQIEKLITIDDSDQAIINAIRFVQDEVRYLGFEEGIKAFMPHKPLEVLERRFGDCKDKSFLLSSILLELGIDAAPTYVHSIKGKSLNEKLPSPNEFDHCIVTFNLNGKQYFVDPTISNQGGDLENLAPLDYEFGLPIIDDSKALIEIQNTRIPLLIVDEIIELDSIDGGAIYTVATKYTGEKSDEIRSYFSSNSRSDIKKEYEDFYRNAYQNIKIEELIIIDSTRESSNEIIVTEVYKVKNIWETSDDELFLNIYSLLLESYLSFDPPEKEDLPFHLGQKFELIQTINVKLPEHWPIQNENENISNRNFDYRFSISSADDEFQIKHRYYLKDGEVAVGDIHKVTNDLDEIFSGISYRLSYNKNLISGLGKKITMPKTEFWLVLILFGLLAFYFTRKEN